MCCLLLSKCNIILIIRNSTSLSGYKVIKDKKLLQYKIKTKLKIYPKNGPNCTLYPTSPPIILLYILPLTLQTITSSVGVLKISP